eukprot:TRINITY_DN11263_c0_g1_i1.p1 TRINITY_DN11263_c0_g1~~TRINITY_DN11263_c0_g1_i1.p1  ORF type:complete len:432 (+),score=104.36 TRINITY_DN11263_c0_g1_i1:95-1390(+)
MASGRSLNARWLLLVCTLLDRLRVEVCLGVQVTVAEGIGFTQLAAARVPVHGPGEFSQYVAHFKRNYKKGSHEYLQRESLFQLRVQRVREQNASPKRLWTASVNHLTDRTAAELRQLLGYRQELSNEGMQGAVPGTSALLSRRRDLAGGAGLGLAASVDWRHLKMAASVPDQLACGSCWAQATAAMLEARHEVAFNTTRTFSAQQLVNCVPNPKDCGGSGGCEGATVELGMQYIQAVGLREETSVPYLGVDMPCDDPYPIDAAHPAQALGLVQSSGLHAGQSSAAASLGLKSWERLPRNDAESLMRALADGPVAISVSADQFYSYKSGIFDGCPKNAIVNHAMLLFGYGEDNGVKYWNVRNSWSPAWGDQGFIRFKRSDTPQADDSWCGVDTDPSQGVACKPYPEKATVCGMCGLLYDSVVAVFQKPEEAA